MQRDNLIAFNRICHNIFKFHKFSKSTSSKLKIHSNLQQEPEFIQRLIAKDQLAFKELVNDYGKKVFNTCLSFLKNDEDAEDVTQEVFIEVFQSIKNFEQKATLSTWIYRIAVTKCLDFQKAAKTKKRFGIIQSLFGINDKDSPDLPKDFNHPGIIMEDKEKGKIVFGAIDKLSENQRIAFTLHNVDDLSYKEIAEVMDISISSVESLIFRARKNLQKLLENYYRENK